MSFSFAPEGPDDISPGFQPRETTTPLRAARQRAEDSLVVKHTFWMFFRDRETCVSGRASAPEGLNDLARGFNPGNRPTPAGRPVRAKGKP